MPETTFRLTPEEETTIRRRCDRFEKALPDGDDAEAIKAALTSAADVRQLLDELDAVRRENTELRTASLHRLVGMVPSGALRNQLAEWVADQQQRASGSGSDPTHLDDAPATPVPAAEEGAHP